MITRSVKGRSLQANRRLDCKYFVSPGTQAAERLAVAAAAGLDVRTIAGGIGDVSAPGRFKRAYAVPTEDGAPYLRPYDVFDYVPQAADILSVKRSRNLARLMAPPGALLQTCSGRNLGPTVAVDAHLAKFALSHDMIRVAIEDEVERYYTLAFLSTPTGQALVRRDKTGSVIDHISVEHLAEVVVPFIEVTTRMEAAALMRAAVELRGEARVLLASAVDALTALLPPLPSLTPPSRGWSLPARALSGRVDAAYYDPAVKRIRAALLKAGGVRVRDVADVQKPSGRYRTYYVGSAHGRPLLSGRQVLQYAPVNLQYISPRSLDPSRYQLSRHTIAFQADGRAEERLGFPVVVEPARDGWLASGHVGRFVPRDGIDPGWLYVACASQHVQVQVKALSCGSVVDALYPDDLAQVVLPPTGNVDGAAVLDAWAKFSEAGRQEARAIGLIEDELRAVTGEAQLSS